MEGRKEGRSIRPLSPSLEPLLPLSLASPSSAALPPHATHLRTHTLHTHFLLPCLHTRMPSHHLPTHTLPFLLRPDLRSPQGASEHGGILRGGARLSSSIILLSSIVFHFSFLAQAAKIIIHCFCAHRAQVTLSLS